VVAGAPGVGKSRAGTALAIAGATGQPWFGLPVHRRFKTAIIQNENGLHRLAREFQDLSAETLDESIRVSEPPPMGMAFDRAEFRAALAGFFGEFQPDVVIVDPWNSVARDDNQRDYRETFDALKAVLPTGAKAPALVIIAHTRKPQGDRRQAGRSLLSEVAGSHLLTSLPRCVFVMQAASDLSTDDRVLWTCSKNNDGALGPRSAWHRRNGLFAPCETFDWESFEAAKPGRKATANPHDVVAALGSGKLSYGELAEAVADRCDTGLRTAKRAISAAVAERLVVNEHGTYRAADPGTSQ
jgi:LmbE family N-acetylglucosaminyl deacetylase